MTKVKSEKNKLATNLVQLEEVLHGAVVRVGCLDFLGFRDLGQQELVLFLGLDHFRCLLAILRVSQAHHTS